MAVMTKIAETSDKVVDTMFDAAETTNKTVYSYSQKAMTQIMEQSEKAMERTFNLVSSGISANRAVAEKVVGRLGSTSEVAKPAVKTAAKPAARKAPAKRKAASRKPASRKAAASK